MTIPIIGCAVVLLVTVIYLEKARNPKYILPAKALLSGLFVVTALVQPHPVPTYYQFLLGGLVLCLAGDVFLAVPKERMFLFGLIAFLAGHVLYIAGFYSLAKIGAGLWPGFLIVLCISGGVYLRLKPYLGSMKIPVLCYVIIISLMAVASMAVMGNFRLTETGRVMIFAGAFCFYFSDMFVARDRFFKREYMNRVVGLPLYYGGQFLLAFSVGVVA